MISTFINISVFHMISTFMTSVFFTWHRHSWHQCLSDMTSVFIWHQYISHIYIIDISVFHMTSTFINISTFPDMTCWLKPKYILPFTFYHLHWWHQRISYMTFTFTFMTSVFFRHDIYIDIKWKPFHLQMDDEELIQ